MLHLVQVSDAEQGRSVARVAGNELQLLAGYASVYDLASDAWRHRSAFEEFARSVPSAYAIEYEAVYRGESDWRLLPPIDHPTEPARCRVTGTGLTHLRSAEARSSMHAGEETETDSSRMYQLGLKGGRPASGQIGAAPEWFYKGDGGILRAHGESLTIPRYACDGGEEAEIAGMYLVDENGMPRRLGFAIGNEFSDHLFERQNYLYLAHSKLRDCALGPELVIGADFQDLQGSVTIKRDGDEVWRKQIRSGEQNMAHSLANLEHHHFKYAAHRRPGDVHVHFFGADALSFGAGVQLEEGDTVEIAFPGFGRPLRNVIARDRAQDSFVAVEPL